MYKVCVFAGTTEGRELIRFLCAQGIRVTACVATDYGASLLKDVPGLKVTAGRLDRERMEAFFREKGYKVLAPEKYSFKEQLNYLWNCKAFAATVGQSLPAGRAVCAGQGPQKKPAGLG